MPGSSSETTPPPLQYSPSVSDQDPFSTRETTPVGTPTGFGNASVTTFSSRRPEKEKDLYFSWHRKYPGEKGFASTQDPALLEPDLDDSAFPLFPSSPPQRAMTGPTPPIDITARQAAGAHPRQQSSNLTSALQRAGNGERSGSIVSLAGPSSSAIKASAVRKDSIGANMAAWGNGTKPISVAGSHRDKQRRESLAGSLVGGMSWGGVSVGSWIRDDIIMTGTSPFATLQSPSFHSSSYLPKLEANFMRDFSCCGVTLPSLHDLLQHYEEAHAEKSPQPPPRNSQNNPSIPDTRAAIAASAAAQYQKTQQNQPDNEQMRNIQPQRTTNNGGQGLNPSAAQQNPQQQLQNNFGSQSHNLPDIDTVEDMEMDDAMGEVDSSSLFQRNQTQTAAQSGFGQQNQGHVTPLNLNMLPSHQALRSSQPGTPVSSRPLSLQNNPTVSSVNTPTLMSHPLQHNQLRGTPDSSTPGTPAELDESLIGGLGDMSMQGNMMPNQSQFPGLGGNGDMVDLCIDEPAKRLFSPNGGFNNSQQYAQFRLGGAQYGPNSEIARRIREQQMLAGVPDTAVGMMPNEEPKPFRCPVIGCEKAYKNQNGLKYHKSHGHNNQQLHDNADGTFSIVNPETSAPYPGTLGMEKEKPYRCEVCGKRYKNLNGLKYHKSHSPPCNPELQLAAGRNVNTGGVMQGQNINVAGAGLTGIGEDGLM